MPSWSLVALVGVIAAVAALLGPRLGISAALIEIVAGILAANYLGVTTVGQSWLPFLASIGSVVLIFLAGTSIDPGALRARWRAALMLGAVSFAGPLLVVGLLTRFLLLWSPTAALLAGVALSSTSAAIVYVVLAEAGSLGTSTGQLLLSAALVTDLGTILALTFLFERPNVYVLLLCLAFVAMAFVLPRFLRWAAVHWRTAPAEPEVRVLLGSLFVLAAIAQFAGTETVLPAYLLGLAVSGSVRTGGELSTRFRTVAFAFLTPFFFVNAGLSVSLAALVGGAAAAIVLYAAQVGAKLGALLPLAHRLVGIDYEYVALMLSTGLVFGIVADLYGLGVGIFSGDQFSVLVAVIVLSAVIPTAVAQTLARPEPTAVAV
jgi:Kef-type K+ transport system membrane component KefB